MEKSSSSKQKGPHSLAIKDGGPKKKKKVYAKEYNIPHSVQKIAEFLEARNQGKYPERSFLEWIEECLRAWYKDQGKTSLEKIMGLKSTGKGKPPSVKEAKLAIRNNLLLMDMAALSSIGFKRHEAAKAVSAKLSASGYRDPIWGTAPSITWESLTDLYENWLRREEVEEYYKDNGSPSLFPKFIKTFPNDSIPERFKEGIK